MEGPCRPLGRPSVFFSSFCASAFWEESLLPLGELSAVGQRDLKLGENTPDGPRVPKMSEVVEPRELKETPAVASERP